MPEMTHMLQRKAAALQEALNVMAQAANWVVLARWGLELAGNSETRDPGIQEGFTSLHATYQEILDGLDAALYCFTAARQEMVLLQEEVARLAGEKHEYQA